MVQSAPHQLSYLPLGDRAPGCAFAISCVCPGSGEIQQSASDREINALVGNSSMVQLRWRRYIECILLERGSGVEYSGVEYTSDHNNERFTKVLALEQRVKIC